jgi:lactobin A/cerein 7B family class IIb bacteriocin
MSDLITSPIELTDAELDCVSGGAANSGAAGGAVGLVAVAAGVSAAADNLVNNNNVLDNNNIPVTVQANILGGGIA